MADIVPKYQISVFSDDTSKQRSRWQVVVRSDEEAEMDKLRKWAEQTVDEINTSEKIVENVNETEHFAESLENPNCTVCGKRTELREGGPPKYKRKWKGYKCTNPGCGNMDWADK